MQHLITIISLGTALASAQSVCNSLVSAVPSCGIPCIYSAGSSVGCASTDYSCLCASALQASTIKSDAEKCVIGSCGSTALDVLTAAQAVCSCVTATPVSATSTASTTSASSTQSSTASPASTASVIISTSVPSSSKSSSSIGSGIVIDTSAPPTLTSAGSLSTSSSSASTTTASNNGQGAVRPWGLEGSILAMFGGLMALF
ncbi:hypothetical protein BDZ45DRAFT_741643 [Acephala macrosclerotiorum]|nr:hypothetical protein BDZ45DRAFT_741643 [Acephala macrosclerotiorum]